METKHTTAITSPGPPTGSNTPKVSTARSGAGKPAARPPSPEAARRLLAAADALEATGGRAEDETSEADLDRLLRGIAPAEAALDRAALMALGAARGRGWSWPRIGTALSMTADGARDRFDRAAARHPDYRAPLAPTLGAHITHAGDLIDAIADPPRGFTRHAATRLLGAVLLAATLDRTPELVAHWLADPALSGAAAAAARHPKAAQAHKALADFVRERPGTRADLLDIVREAVRSTPWALDAAEHTNAAGDGRLRLHPGGGLLAVSAEPTHPPTPDTDPDHGLADLPPVNAPASTSGEETTRRLLGAAQARNARDLAHLTDTEGDDVAAAVSAAGWRPDAAGPVHTLVSAVRFLTWHLPENQARPARALVQAVDAADGPGLVAAVAGLRELSEATQTELLAADGLAALDALPGTDPAPKAGAAPGCRDGAEAGKGVGTLLELANAIRRRLPDLAPGAVADALRALAEAIDTGAPALLEEPMAAVAALDAAERAQALGVTGEQLWERTHRDRTSTSPAAAGLPAANEWPPTLAGPVAEILRRASTKEPLDTYDDLDLNASALGEDLSGAADLAALDTLISDHLAQDTDPAVREALRAFADAIGQGTPEQLNAAMAAVADLDPDARARAWSKVGERLWQQVHQASGWKRGTDHKQEETERPRGTSYTAALEKAGLPRATADALVGPLSQFVAAADLVAHREVNEQTRQVLQALVPTMMSQRPARVRTLLYLLPNLNLYGLDEWAPLALTISEHASQLEHPTSAASLLREADLPAHLADAIDALVRGARRALVASWAPTAPAWQPGPALEQLTSAVEGGDAEQLPAALEAVAELEQATNSTDAGLAPELSHRWQNLAYSWRRARPARAEGAPAPVAQTPSPWPDKAERVLPDHPDLAAALAAFLDAIGGRAGVQQLSGLAKDQRAYEAIYHLVRVVDTGDRPKIGDALEDVVKLKPSRAPLGKHRPERAAALRALIDAYDHQ